MNQPFSEETLAANIREVTDEEVAFYQEHGWVKMDGLVSPELVEILRSSAESLLETRQFSLNTVDGLAAVRGLEPFRSFVFSKQMCRMAHRLINRRRLTDADVPTRIRLDILGRRDPDAHTERYAADPSRILGNHQDSSEHGSDRVGEFNGWLALAEVTADMGAMRFLTGVHREGPLGTTATNGQGHEDARFRDLVDTYPNLLDLYEWSPPFHYRPGDMTVHHGYMIHGSPANSTDKPRWFYLISYAPADTKLINGEVKNNGALRTLPDDALHPIVYPVR